MNSTEITTPMLVDLAMQAEITDPIDWAQLSIEERQAFTLMATSVVEQINGIPQEQRLMVAMATMTKLLVENFVLNVKLTGEMK
jgi:hypothetical protein